MLESNLQSKCIKAAKKLKVFGRKVMSPGRRGFPDTLFIFDGGETVYVELKTPVGRLSKLQKRTIRKMRAQGATVYVLDNLFEFKAVLNLHKGEN